jgi:hypothetical protein
MPVEGLEPTAPATPAPSTPDAGAINTAAPAQPATGTQPATEATEKTFTQEQVNAMISKRLPSAVKAELKKLGGDPDGGPTVEQLQQQLNDEKAARQKAEARQTVGSYLDDPKNKLNIPSESRSTVVKLAMLDLEFDKDGNPSNLKDVIESLKASDPRLFANTPGSINAGNGRDNTAAPTDMNSFIRQVHASRN